MPADLRRDRGIRGRRDALGHAESLAKLLPEDASSILRRQLDDLAQDTPGKLGGGVIAALVVAFWSASRGAFNLLKAIQWIFGLGEVRSALRQRLLAFAMMVGTVVFITIAVGLIAAVPPILELLQLEGAWRLLRSARWLFLTATVVASIGVLFRLAEGAPIRIRTVLSPGVVVATALWIVVQGDDQSANCHRRFGSPQARHAPGHGEREDGGTVGVTSDHRRRSCTHHRPPPQKSTRPLTPSRAVSIDRRAPGLRREGGRRRGRFWHVPCRALAYRCRNESRSPSASSSSVAPRRATDPTLRACKSSEPLPACPAGG